MSAIPSYPQPQAMMTDGMVSVEASAVTTITPTYPQPQNMMTDGMLSLNTDTTYGRGKTALYTDKQKSILIT